MAEQKRRWGDRRGKAAKATLALVGTVREAAGFPKE